MPPHILFSTNQLLIAMVQVQNCNHELTIQLICVTEKVNKQVLGVASACLCSIDHHVVKPQLVYAALVTT